MPYVEHRERVDAARTMLLLLAFVTDWLTSITLISVSESTTIARMCVLDLLIMLEHEKEMALNDVRYYNVLRALRSYQQEVKGIFISLDKSQLNSDQLKQWSEHNITCNMILINWSVIISQVTATRLRYIYGSQIITLIVDDFNN